MTSVYIILHKHSYGRDPVEAFLTRRDAEAYLKTYDALKSWGADPDIDGTKIVRLPVVGKKRRK